jgi:nucleoside-diphosphate-sugar epimerase
VRRFLENGREIITHGSSKISIEKLENQLKRENFNLDNVQFWEQDFLKKEWNFPDFSQIENIIHCAAATKVREGTLENYDKYFKLNVLAPKKLAKKALDLEIAHFIHLSSGQVFGIPSSFPITEKTPRNPINLYGYTKLMGEQIISSYGLFGLSYTIARPFSIYGKGHYNIISIISDKITNDEILTIYGDGTQSRAFLHIDDFCAAIMIILNNEKCFNETFNLSGSIEYSVNKLLELLSDRYQKKPQIAFKEANVNELKRNVADLSKIRKLGFTPKRTLEEFINKEL